LKYLCPYFKLKYLCYTGSNKVSGITIFEWWCSKTPFLGKTWHPGLLNARLGGGELGHSLGALGHGMLGKLTREHQAHGGLDLTGGDGGLLVVPGQLGGCRERCTKYPCFSDARHVFYTDWSTPEDLMWANVSVHELSEMLRFAYSNPDEVKAIGHRAREHICSHFTREQAFEKIQTRIAALVQR